ncbi:MAG TPA: hypothetical protein DEO94_03975 [Cyanobacteria bacterium UBA11991]|nr:hypothetical protein [Cyanobacteria bacterium UBA11991]
MSKYKIKHTSIMHNGKVCKEGSVIELTDAQAAKLADFVVLVPATKPKTNTQTKTQATKTETKTQNSPENKNEGGVKDGE